MMATQTVEQTLLAALEQAFVIGKYDLAYHIVKALQAFAYPPSRNDEVMEEVNKLPGANPVHGFFLRGLCVEEQWVHFTDLNSLQHVQPLLSHNLLRDNV